ncbi:hypothetical protein I4641_12545 [Waterburya agarophytonicola K14]|uniref:Uncharacterized protein n=1 Tax=Waterburya agarophytonicola KI4 TaxID=2874699 RepID=A0A964FG55_9CYAN|nr:hypothetical protein [Waterburya agarophytonicola]MBE9047612.1 hypothetical protein [Pleurocapsales cyanobacterium LEGE 10410]MCC0177807.1 hypothetical protein [Waterburya agarophytonicola KI4]
MMTLDKNRFQLLKANLEKLIATVGLANVSDYIVSDKTISEIEKTSLLFLVENKLAYKDI